MGDKTGIAWTEATWNPVTGCSHVSAGCEHCYAEVLSLRRGWSAKPWTAPNAAENVVLHPERLDQPLRWQKPRRIFVNSMSDLFHERITDTFIDQVFHAMTTADHHVYQILTKRPERMRDFVRHWMTLESRTAMPGHIWLGVSIEQDRWCSRADILRQTPAAVRFISAEPLLEPLPSLSLAGIDWLIFGGESGPGGRWMVVRCRHETVDPQGGGSLGVIRYMPSLCPLCDGSGWRPVLWARMEARRLRALTHAAGGAYFLKQYGGPTPKSAGNLLDDRTWEEFPAVSE